MATIVDSKDLIFVEQGQDEQGNKKNNNKEWHCYLHDNNDVETTWGRVGSTLASKVHHGAGRSKFDSLVRSKLNKGYTIADVIKTDNANVKSSTVGQGELNQVAKTQIKTNSPEAASLIDLLVKENRHTIMKNTTMTFNTSTGLFSTPMGLVSAATISQARVLLDDLSGYVTNRDYNSSEFMKGICQYLRYIPQEIPRSGITAQWMFPDIEAVRKQNDILDALEASLQTAFTPASNGDTPAVQEKVFEAKLFLVQDGQVIDRIARKYRDTRKDMHVCAHLKLNRVFEIDIAHMSRDFDSYGQKIGNVHEYWHGTKVSNLLSILKNGFIIPKGSGVVNGSMFGVGCYFSDTSTKSLNYAYGYWDGSRSNLCYMLICDVAMGRPYAPSSYRESLPKAGYDSTNVKAGTAGVMNHEAIVYNTKQIKPKFLCEFKG